MHCLKTIENEVHYVVYLLFVELPDILFFVFRIHYSKLATKGNEKSGYPLKKTLISHTRYLYILRSCEYKIKLKKKRQKHSPDSRVVATTRNMTTCRTRQTRYGSQVGAGERNACALIKLSEHFYFRSP